ncbi:acyl-CoA dehydrogenase family protein [Streptomyces shenzhenensis]|uniref:acyl-CoA dehydrogenase family protein n=1 Tax=Streptomyces shenzhenensis TaxID=943815 RepID=UPI0033D116B5
MFPPVTSERVRHLQEFLRWYAANRHDFVLVDDRRSLPPSFTAELGEAGLLGLQVEPKYKGQGLTYHETAQIMTQLAAIDINLCIFAAVHNSVGITPIRLFGSDSLKQQVLPPLAQGIRLAGIAASEPGMGSNLGAITTFARQAPTGGYLLDGTKKWISLGGLARHLTVFARLQDDQGRENGISAFLVDTRSDGFTVGPEALTIGMRAVPQHEITLSGVHVPLENMLGEIGDGAHIAHTTFNGGRLFLTAAGIGAMKRCLQLAYHFADQRQIATGRLADNGLTREILAHCTASVTAVQWLVDYITAQLDRGEQPSVLLTYTAKIIGCELTWEVVDRCVQLLGARGYLDSSLAGKFLRDYRILRLFEGSTETLSVHLGMMILRAPRAFTEQLIKQFDGTPAVTDAIADFSRITAQKPADKSDRHVLASIVGRAACWIALTSVAQTAAMDSRSPMSAYALAWCEYKLAEFMAAATREPHPGLDRPSDARISEEVQSYEAAIGAVDYHLPGEYRDLDPLLKRPH